MVIFIFNKRIAISLFLIAFLFFSISSIQATDVNGTGDVALGYIDDNVRLDNEAQLNELESVNSNNDDSTYMDSGNTKNQTELISQNQKNQVYNNGYYNVVLKDSALNTTVANKNVTFIVGDVNYIATTDNNGIVGINLKGIGNYNVTVNFAGDDDYEPSTLTSTVKVLSTVKASDVTKYYGGSKQYTATFYDSNGNYLKNRMITVTVNGKSYSKKTNSLGAVSIPVNLKPGNYKVVSTNPVTGDKLTTNFKILSTITSSDFKKVAGDSNKFVVKFFKSNGKALSNQYVKFKVKGVVYKVKTYSNGKATFAFKSFKNGVYKIVSYNKDGLTKTNTVTIYKMASTKLTTSSYTFLPGDAKKIQVKFTTALGDSSKAGKTIKIEIGSKVFSKKTDSNGIINLDISSVGKGLYFAEYSYAGDKFFKASSSKNPITILDTNITQLSVKSTTSFGYGAGTLFKVALTAGGVPLIKKSVIFNIGDAYYGATTDNNGIASVPINLDIGNHTISYYSNKDSEVEAASNSCLINVFERSPAKVTWKSGTSFKDSSQTFKVLVTDSEGKPSSGQTVELTIDGAVFTAKTASNGYVTFKTFVFYGRYNVSVNALGNNNLLPSSTSKTINVAISKYKNGINERASGALSSAYLKSSRHCSVNAVAIKSVVTKVTKGLTHDVDKAKAIFNYVCDNIVYSYYYNSKHGSTKTLNKGYGNCVDQAHLLISIYRTAGLKARYVHGKCTFGDGRFGHVWTQVLIGNTWVVGDPISTKNKLGVIKNWNTKTCTIHNKYISLPF